MNERPTEEKKACKTLGLGSDCFTPCGSSIRIRYVWNSDYSGLEKVGEEDLQEEIEAAALGRAPGEQVARIMRGDYSCMAEGEGLTGDQTGTFEKTSGEVLMPAIQKAGEAYLAAEASGLKLEELEEQLSQVEQKLKLAKEIQAAKAKEKENA